jgi:hypothetical protein
LPEGRFAPPAPALVIRNEDAEVSEVRGLPVTFLPLIKGKKG